MPTVSYCSICNIPRYGNYTRWFVVAPSIVKSASGKATLTIQPWNEYAARQDANAIACGIDHVLVLAERWLTKGDFDE
jgi:hypothetical protein